MYICLLYRINELEEASSYLQVLNIIINDNFNEKMLSINEKSDFLKLLDK